MKTLDVVAAVIEKNGLLLATQRGYRKFEGLWKFPGGKVENGEAPKDALEREILEELNIKIQVGELITTVDYDYSSFHLHMRCYLCHVVYGEISLLEHHARAMAKSRGNDRNRLAAS